MHYTDCRGSPSTQNFLKLLTPLSNRYGTKRNQPRLLQCIHPVGVFLRIDRYLLQKLFRAKLIINHYTPHHHLYALLCAGLFSVC